MSEAQETTTQLLAVAPEAAVDSDEDQQQPTLKTGLTENLQDMEIQSAEDTEPMDTEGDDTGGASEDKPQGDYSNPEDTTSEDANQDELESKKEDETTSGEVEKADEEAQGSREGNSQPPTILVSQDGDQPIQQRQPPGRDSDTDGKSSDVTEDVRDDDVKSSQQDICENELPAGAETSCSVKDKLVNEPKDNQDIELKETHKEGNTDSQRTPTRRSRSQEEEEEEEEDGEKGKTDEHQNERGAKKAKKERDDDAGAETRQRTLRPRVPDLSQMHTLNDFGYEFNEEGELRQIKTGLPFVFEVVANDRSFNQKHYEALGEIITQHVFGLMETECNLERAPVPVDATEHDPRTFIFVSENVPPVLHGQEPSDKKLLVLIHGSGVVRAGQWARRLIINNSLDQGTMIPYIKQAKEDGYEVMVLNTNYNSDRGRMIKGSSSPESHGRYVWTNYIAEWPGKVAIVAHSAGGYVTVEMAKCPGFMDKVIAVGFTDSVHSLGYYTSREVTNWFIKHSKNWVSSSKPLDTTLGSYGGDCPRVSAGTPKHEETSYYSMESIFKFFGEMEMEKVEPNPCQDEHEDEDVDEMSEDVPEEPTKQRMSRGLEGDTEENRGSKKVQTDNVQILGAKGDAATSAGELGRTEGVSEKGNARHSSDDDENNSKEVKESEEKQEENKEEL